MAGKTLWKAITRTTGSIPSLFGVVVITFLLTRALPGDPAAYFAGASASPTAVEEIRARLGLDRSLWVQFFHYLGDLAHGDLGQSLTTGQTVLSEIWTRLPASLELTLLGLFMAAATAIPLGVLAATRPNSPVDHASRLIATAGVSLPVFFSGLLLVYVFYFKLGWAPAPMGRLDAFMETPRTLTGFYLIDSLLQGDLALFRAALAQLILPSLTMGLFAMAPLMRMTRAAMLGVLSSDFIRTSRAHGLGRARILWGYAFRNSLTPIVTTLGMVFSYLLGANVLVEKVFAWPGIGSFALEALVASDYAPVQGFVLAMGILYVTLNLFIDILIAFLDPRMEAAR
jgi:ABC-type dipeptide/oligopeptide/nickel transport system permease component